MKEVIIDIETLGVEPNSVILTIGGIRFERYEKLKNLEEYETFYVRIDIDSCLEEGLKTEQATCDWWDNQPDQIRFESVFHPDRMSLKNALSQLSEFVKDSKCIWSQGSFDSVILENAYRKCGIEIPWKFWNIRDSRTLFDILSVDLKSIEYKKEEVHNALVDCYRQLMATCIAFRKLLLPNL